MSEIKALTERINKFVRERNWERYQKPKDLAISLVLEASELLEHFQWRGEKDSKIHITKSRKDVEGEIADVAIYLFKLADKIKVDLPKAIEKKLVKASQKYPIKTVKGETRLKSYYKIKRKYRQ